MLSRGGPISTHRDGSDVEAILRIATRRPQNCVTPMCAHVPAIAAPDNQDNRASKTPRCMWGPPRRVYARTQRLVKS